MMLMSFVMPWNRQADQTTKTLALIRSDLATLLQKVNAMSATVTSELAALTAQVAASTSAEQSALTLINGFSARLDAAVAAASAAGATPEQLQALTDEVAALKASADPLAAAVAANAEPPPAAG